MITDFTHLPHVIPPPRYQQKKLQPPSGVHLSVCIFGPAQQHHHPFLPSLAVAASCRDRDRLPAKSSVTVSPPLSGSNRKGDSATGPTFSLPDAALRHYSTRALGTSHILLEPASDFPRSLCLFLVHFLYIALSHIQPDNITSRSSATGLHKPHLERYLPGQVHRGTTLEYGSRRTRRHRRNSPPFHSLSPLK